MDNNKAPRKKYTVFLSAAEPSADIHCANLIKALKAKNHQKIEFVGIGGPNMAQQGCQIIEDTTAKAKMLLAAITNAYRFWKLLRRINRYFTHHRPDLVIVCDSPAFNFHVAKKAKKHQIKTMFYVAPQLWAWAPGRIRKLRKRCDKLACILPFEQRYFSERHLDTTFVGNPLFDNLPQPVPRPPKKYQNHQSTQPLIALMPGSRKAEIDSLWQPMQQAAMQIKHHLPDAKFVAVPVDKNRQDILKSKQLNGFKCDYKICSVFETASQADFCFVASGSATLQVAGAACPMVVMYQTNRFLWHLLGKYIIKTKYLCLVNILANEELVPEFMPYFTSTDPIVQAAMKIIGDPKRMTKLSQNLHELTLPLAKNASDNTANIVLQMLDQRTRSAHL